MPSSRRADKRSVIRHRRDAAMDMAEGASLFRPTSLPPLAPPGRDERAQHQEERRDRREERGLAEAGDDVVLVGAEADPVAPGGAAPGGDAAELRQIAGAGPEGAAARRLHDGGELLGGGADVRELDRVERA